MPAFSEVDGQCSMCAEKNLPLKSDRYRIHERALDRTERPCSCIELTKSSSALLSSPFPAKTAESIFHVC